MTGTVSGPCGRWTARLREFVPGYCREAEALAPVWEAAAIILHGSTAMGIDDDASDLDLWLVLPDEGLAALDRLSQTRFFEFELDGKIGHLNACSESDFAGRIAGCHMDTIWQLRRSRIIHDGSGRGERFVAEASRPMRPEVRDALFFYHYVEMRGEHRACDTPIVRGESIALLLGLPKTLAHALRAAIVIAGEPYPYDKWLHRAALGTPAGRAMQPHVEAVLDSLAADGLREQYEDENEHTITVELRAIRQVLIEAAREHGIDEPWLSEWWLHMDQARAACENARW